MQGIKQLAISSVITLIAGAISYLILSKYISIEHFAVYSLAIGVTKLFSYLIDSGIKISIIRSKDERLAKKIKTTIILYQIMMIIMVLLAYIFNNIYELGDEFTFIIFYVMPFALTMPLISVYTGYNEKNKKFGKVAKAESISNVIEYVLPIYFIIEIGFSSYVIVPFVWISRIARLYILENRSFTKELVHAKWNIKKVKQSKAFAKEVGVYQLSSILSSIRDNLQFIIIMPIIGLASAGYYSWAMQMVGLASQIIINPINRVILPSLAGEKNKGQNQIIKEKMIVLSLRVILPIIIPINIYANFIDATLYENKWEISLILIPYIAFRMIAGAIIGPVFNYFLNTSTHMEVLKFNLVWTLSEIIVAFIITSVYGFVGLAIAYAVTPYLIICYLYKLNGINIFRWIKLVINDTIILINIFIFLMVHLINSKMEINIWVLAIISFTMTAIGIIKYKKEK